MKRISVLLICLVLPAFANGDDKWWAFVDRAYYEPLIAGVREPHLSALALGWATSPAYVETSDTRLRIWDIDAGAEIPIVGWESALPVGGDRRVPNGQFGVGLWIPIDIHVIELFGIKSNPILNTDYRFGGMLKLQYGVAPQQWLSGRIHIGHESTHLGDEYSITAPRDFPDTFERINVSWEYIDAGVMYENVARGLSLRAGVTATLPFRDSYYSTDPEGITESPIGPVTPSTNWYDPYAGVELLFEEILPRDWDLYASGELRWRSVYDYHKDNPGDPEERQASINLIVGAKPNGRLKASPFVRFYRGVNPHGQFRDQKDYTAFGIGLRVVR